LKLTGVNEMKFGTLEILATILIAFSVIKLVVVSISPQSWLMFAKKIYIRPKLTSAVAFVLAVIVLFFLIKSGITIVHILAISLFIVLLMVIGMAKYADRMIDWMLEQDIKILLKEFWFYTLIWIVLLLWGIQAILFP
jgi:hypothetical protein